MPTKRDIALERGLPSNELAEKCVLSSVFRANVSISELTALISPQDFTISPHQHIYQAMIDLDAAGSAIDRVTLAHELIKHGKLERSGGLTLITSLDSDLPDISNPISYAEIVRECAALRKIIFTASEIQKQALLRTANATTLVSDAVGWLNTIDQELSTSDKVQNLKEIIDEVGPSEILNPARTNAAMPTGFHALDEMIGGLSRKTFVIIGARPSMGKSSIASNIAVKLAYSGTPVAIFSMEMSKRNYIERMICSLAEASYSRLRTGMLFEDERKRVMSALNTVHSLPIFIDESTALTHQQISSKIHRLVTRHGVAVAMIDYLQQMGSEYKSGRDRNPNERFTEITEALRNTAKREDVCVLALSQLSRAPEQRRGDHKPLLSDLRDSGNLEQAADVVMFIYRHFFYHPGELDRAEDADILVRKQRNGPTGDVKLRWKGVYTRFENY